MEAQFSAGRFRAPDAVGVANRDGVELAWASYGSTEPTLVLLPTWSIVDSRIWKAQVPYLSRHFRVVTFDGRGSGRSGRPQAAADYSDEQYAADTIAVMDAAGVDDAILVGFSRGGAWGVLVAAEHPARVRGLFAIAPSGRFAITDSTRQATAFNRRFPSPRGASNYNRYAWLNGGYPDFLASFFPRLFNEPHSSKQIEDAIGWGLAVEPETAVATTAGWIGIDGASSALLEPMCARVQCPVTVVHCAEDQIVPSAVALRFAELTGGTVLTLEGAGHGPMARHPVIINTEIRRFAERCAPDAERKTGARRNTMARRHWARPWVRPKRVLYLSSPIGLGHARRDLSIVEALRQLAPGVAVDWLTQDPVTRMLSNRGERVHPASRFLASESAHIEEEAGEHDLHAFGAIRRMDDILVNNFMVFADLVESEQYDLVVGDEAWDVDHFLHENPELKRFSYAWMTDFVGWLPMTDGGDAEVALTADYNAEMLEQRERFRRLRDRSIFVGNPDDIVNDTFGPGLPGIRDWTTANFDFAGYIGDFDPAELGSREEIRTRLGYRADDCVCVVTVGGSGVGEPLLRRVLDAIPVARRVVPALRCLVVTGPRIDPRSLPRRRGTQVVGYLPKLVEHLAACDVAVVQGGLSTCMELTALRRPFVYVPLRHHFEQQYHVRHRLERYGAGRCMTYEQAADPHALAAAIVDALQRQVTYRPVETGGAARAAGLLSDLL